MTKKILKFRQVRNVFFDIGDGVLRQPKMSIVEQPHAYGPLQTVQFDHSEVYCVELENDEPQVIERTKGMSEPWYNRLLDAEFDRALKAREKNADLMRRVDLYVADGTIELVTDEEPIGSSTEAA
jgi:hypothetical protein